MGCVSQAGEQAMQVGRNAVLASKLLPESTPAVTIDRQCGSSQQAIMSRTQDVVIAAGIESMCRVPMGSTASFHLKEGLDMYKSPGLEEKYPGIMWSQFMGAEMIVDKHGLTKDDLDRFAYESHLRAIATTQAGAFNAEIVPITIDTPEGEQQHIVDEGIRFDATLESIASVKLLSEKGRITAASSSQICDGSSAALIVSEKMLKDHGLTPMARIHNLTVTAGDPVIMLEEPLFATDRALQRAGMSINDIDLFEVNEAFASEPLAWLKHTAADPEKLNVNGGAIALGHPLGASGTCSPSAFNRQIGSRSNFPCCFPWQAECFRSHLCVSAVLNFTNLIKSNQRSVEIYQSLGIAGNLTTLFEWGNNSGLTLSLSS
jgi:acetyl-CoA C-acetyltransferase